jgi:hypothetical protein
VTGTNPPLSPRPSLGAAVLVVGATLVAGLSSLGGRLTRKKGDSVAAATLQTGLAALILGSLATVGSAGSVPESRQSSLSTRAEVGLGAKAEFIGFVIRKKAGTGGDGAKLVLLRVLGPALAAQGVARPLRHPVLTLYDTNGGLIASDAGWQNAPQMSPGYFWRYEAGAPGARAGAMVRPAQAKDAAAAGASPLVPGAEDAALVALLPPGAYTVKVSGAPDSTESDEPTTGEAQTEIFALEGSDDSLFTVLSARAFVGSSEGLDVTGTVAPGAGSGTFLIRGVGPTLGRFDAPGALRWPILTVSLAGGPVLASNEGWGNPTKAAAPLRGLELRPATAADMDAVGAFALHAGSSDSALVLTLPPGAYTANVSSADQATGIALVEFYRLAH